MPCLARIVACMPFCATSALATDFAAEIAPWRTTSGVGDRAPLSAMAFASTTRSRPIRRAAIAGAAKPETMMPSQLPLSSRASLNRP